ncbi:MAG: DUF4838 domain-containing protein [Lentisphaerae bacterium]|nr:DUF4838 domain-containing protein [Lentisphaerota bacterium]
MWVVKNGCAKCNVVVPPDADEVMGKAAADLVRIVRKVSGAVLPRVRSGSPRDSGTGIRLKVDVRLARRVRGLPPNDVFRIACDGRTVIITGAHTRAVAYGVYEFLEQTTGVRWFFPGSLGEDVPTRKNLLFKRGCRTYHPGFAWRAVGENDIPSWTLNHKMALFPTTGGHAYDQLLPKSLFARKPELFSLIYGKRRKLPTQICHTSSGIIDRALNYIDEQIHKKPEAVAISFCPNDMGYFCECDKCHALDDVTKYYDHFVKEPPYGYGGPVAEAHLSERVFGFTNRVAERLARTHPDKYLICYAYGAYRFPPKGMKIRDNVIIWLTHTCVGMFNAERRRIEIEMFRQWRKVAKHVVIYEALANQCWPCLPREVSPLVADQFKLIKRFGMEGYYTQMFGDFATNLPSYYLAARLTWDPYRDEKKELQELYRRGFGAAAQHIAAYYKVLENAWRAKTEDGSLPWARSVIATKRQYGIYSLVYTRRVMSAARAAIDRAKAAVRGKGVYARRVQFVEAGLKYTELMMDAVHECIAIEDMNIPLLYTAPWLKPAYPYDYVKILMLGNCDRRVVAHACRRALTAFDRVDRFVKPFNGKYILAPDIVARSSRDGVREILREILKIAEVKNPDRTLERKMFVTNEI